MEFAELFLNRTRTELRNMDHRTRKLMTIPHRENIERVYVKRTEGGRGITSIEDYVKAANPGLQEYTRKRKEKQTETAKNCNNHKKRHKDKVEKEIIESKKQKWEEK